MTSFVCSICGQTHQGLPAQTLMRPDPWLALTEEEKTKGACSDDLCYTPDRQYFIRCVLTLPLVGGPDPSFEFGLWSSLSEANFKRYYETFDDADQAKLGAMFGYLSNEIPGFEGSFALKVNVHPRNDRQRPWLELEPTDHPLSVAQRNGISFEKVLEIIHPELEAGSGDA